MTKPTAPASCRCRIPLGELAGQLGATDDYAADRVAALGHEVAVDWCGRRAVGVEVAAEVYASTMSARDEHSAKWEAYQDYLAKRRQDAEAERLAGIAKARADARTVASRFSKKAAAQAEREAMAAAEQAAAERAAKAGSPQDFERFAKEAG